MRTNKGKMQNEGRRLKGRPLYIKHLLICALTMGGRGDNKAERESCWLYRRQKYLWLGEESPLNHAKAKLMVVGICEAISRQSVKIQ